MNTIASVKSIKPGWLLPTSLVLTVLMALYVVILFPSDSWLIIIPYISAFAAMIVFIFIGITIFNYYNNVKMAEYTKLRGGYDKKIKSIEEVVWRNRYVLQSAKDKIMNNNTIYKHQQWNDIKVEFIRSKVFPVIPEAEVPLQTVSNILEKAIGASSLNSKPPVYKVKRIKKA